MTVDGVQGRYYAPILPAAICGIHFLLGSPKFTDKIRKICGKWMGSLTFLPVGLLFLMQMIVIATYFQAGLP